MIARFQNSFRPPDMKIPEAGEKTESTTLASVPTIDHLKCKLQDIFSTETSDRTFINHVPDISSWEENKPATITLEDGTIVVLPDPPGSMYYENATKTDDNGSVYLKDGELQAHTTYKLNGNLYTTDAQGRIIHCKARPERSPENPRDINAQLSAGGADRRPSDQGGHIVGRDLNGDGGAGNLVAMDSKINQSDYKRMENDIKASLDEGRNVDVITDVGYSGNSKRPDVIVVTVTADQMKTVYKFDNNVDDCLKNEVPENGKETVQEEQNDTNGKISSIKEEYNEAGELVKTTVNITYTDETGVNHRTKVYIDEE